jgi:hypothetical protein
MMLWPALQFALAIPNVSQKAPFREQSTSASCNPDSTTSIILFSSQLTLHTRRIGKPLEIIPLRRIVSSTLSSTTNKAHHDYSQSRSWLRGHTEDSWRRAFPEGTRHLIHSPVDHPISSSDPGSVRGAPEDVLLGLQTWRDPIGLDARQLAFGQAVGIRPQIRAHRRWRHLSFHASISSLRQSACTLLPLWHVICC